MIFLESTNVNIHNIKVLLFCFEEMLCLRINYHKSEVFTIGIEESEAISIA